MGYFKNENYEEFIHSFNIPIILQKFDQQLIQNGYGHLVEYHLDKFYYLIHKLNQSHLEQKDIEPDDFVSLHSDILGNLFGKNYYKPILNTLIQLRLIESDNSYLTSWKCKGYRLTEGYRNLPSTYIKRVSYAGSFIWKLNEYYKNKHLKCLNRQEYRAAYENITKVSFDVRKTIRTLKEKCKLLDLDTSLIPKDLCPLKLEHAKNHYLLLASEGSRKIAYWLSAVMRIVKKDWHFCIDEKGFRLHSNITVLPKDLRKCLMLSNSNDLVELDIPSSQLLFLAVLLKRKLKKSGQYHEDVVLFIKEVINEDMYINIGCGLGVINSNWDKERIKEVRAIVKKNFFKFLLFCKPYANEYTRYFHDKYPTVLSYIFELKKDDYRHASITLQKVESTFIFGKVIKDLLEVYPDIAFLTVHDSIICKKSNAILIRDTMVKCFYEIYQETMRIKSDPKIDE